MKPSHLWIFASLFLAFSCQQGNTLKSSSASSKPAPKPNYPYSPSRTIANDLLHIKLEVSFDWAKQYLNGKATLTLKPYFYPQNTVQLDAKGFDIASVKNAENGQPLQYAYDGKKLSVSLEKSYARDQTYALEIVYTAKPNELPKGGSAAINSDKGLFFINPLGKDSLLPRQIWTQGETESSSCWFPTMDTPNEKTTQEIYITVDKQFTTLSNGLLISSTLNADGTRTDYWKHDKPHAPYLVMMAIGEFSVVKDVMPQGSGLENLEVNYYVEPKYAPHAKAVFGNTPEMIQFFSKLLNYPYPWGKYSQIVVREYVSGAMENTSATVLMDGLQCTTREMLDKNWDNIIAHELFHHWFGDLVTAESWPNLPLNESFANYSEYLWQEYKYGKDAAEHHALEEMEGYVSESTRKKEPLIRYHMKDREDMFDAHSYNKGGRVLHMLRKLVGDEAFFQSLNLYLKRKEYRAAEIHDLRLAFEEVTGQDLNWFFSQWFLSAGHPVLTVRQNYADGKIKLFITQDQDTTIAPVYRLPMKVAFWTNGQKQSYPIEVNKKAESFEFTASTEPDLVIVDEESQLLGLISHHRTVREYARKYQWGESYRQRIRALEGLTATAVDSAITIATMEKALSDPFHEIRKVGVEYFDVFRKLASTTVAAKIRDMATSDPKTNVRSIALHFVGKEKEPADSVLFLKGLSDSSYVVQSASLKAFMNTSSSRKDSILKTFETSENGEIKNTLAVYYVDKKVPNKHAWYIQNIAKLSGEPLFLFLDQFGKYLPLCSDTEKTSSVKTLENLARNHAVYYVRYAAFKALVALPETKELRKDIADKEFDERLREVYKRFN
jgi:aminopeptidase N